MFHAIAAIVVITWYVLRVLVPALIVGRLALAVVRFARLPRGSRHHWLLARWHRLRWRWLCINLGLAYIDAHRKAVKPVPFGTSVKAPPPEHGKARMRYPRARFHATEHGIEARLRTVPKTGRAELEKAAPYIADQWKCVRCAVRQAAPGRLILAGIRTDPLLTPLPEAYRPAGLSPWHVYLGRDEWGTDRSVPLAGVTGWTVGGLPGFGKTCFVCSLLDQLAGTEAVQFVFIDGKGGGDYAAWEDRAWLHCGDDLADAAPVLEDVHSLMRSRLADVAAGRLPRNSWHRGPTPENPMIVTVIDECHSYFDLDAVKGERDAERHVRTCRTMAGQLVRKGRSVLFLTIFLTQKQTSDAIPTAIRDNCRLGLSFATRTTDASVAALGEGIRGCPSYDPATLQDPAYIGVVTAGLRTGQDPFVRLRVPELSEAAVEARAAETACKRLDPAAIPAPVPAAETPPLEAVDAA